MKRVSGGQKFVTLEEWRNRFDGMKGEVKSMQNAEAAKQLHDRVVELERGVAQSYAPNSERSSHFAKLKTDINLFERALRDQKGSSAVGEYRRAVQSDFSKIKF